MEHKQELSYLDLLSLLKDSVESDSIPATEKDSILRHIRILENLLYRYSY